MKKSVRIRVFWLLLFVLAILPTSVVTYVYYLKASGNLASEIAAGISAQTKLNVSLKDIQFEDPSLSKIVLEGFVLHNPSNKDYPYLDADSVRIDGFMRDHEFNRFGTVTLSSYSFSVTSSGTGSKNSSGEVIKRVAAGISRAFIDQKAIDSVKLGRGRLILVVKDEPVELSISEGTLKRETLDGKEQVVGSIVFDAMDSENLNFVIEFSASGSASKPEIKLSVNAKETSIGALNKMFSEKLGDGTSAEGTVSVALSYSAGVLGKDHMTLELELSNARISLAEDKRVSFSSSKISNQVFSEPGTYPDIENLFLLKDFFSPSLELKAEFDTLRGTWQTNEFEGALVAVEMAESIAKVSCGELLLKNDKGNVTVGSGTFNVSKNDDSLLFKAENGLTSIHFSIADKIVVLNSVSGSLEISAQGYEFETQSILRAGGTVSAYGKTTALQPCILGEFHLKLSDVPFTAVRSFYSPALTGPGFKAENISGNIDLVAQGNLAGKGSIDLKIDEPVVKINADEFQQPEMALRMDFEFENGLPQVLKDVKLDFGSAFSFNGRIEFTSGKLKNVQVESARVDSDEVLKMIKDHIPSIKALNVEGSLVLDGHADNFADDFIPASCTFNVKVIDEINIISTGNPISTEVRGLTGSFNLFANRSGDSLKFSLNGDLLPEQVNFNSKRLFLSSQRVTLLGDFQYKVDKKVLSITKFRVESEVGLIEEISGNVRFAGAKAELSLKIKDRGLTLEQVLQLVENVPQNMQIKGGNFILERTLEGTLDQLRSSYRLTLNNLTVDSRTLKIKGLGLLIEFP